MNSISYGTYKIKTYVDLYAGLDMALSHGIRHFDLAELYKNHNLFGDMFYELLEKYNLKRNDVWLTSKINFTTILKPDIEIINHIDKIFLDLRIDYIDLLLIHGPTLQSIKGYSPDENNLRIWRILSSYNDNHNNKIYNIGVSNFNFDRLMTLNQSINMNKLKPIYCNQIELNPFVFERQTKLIQYCKNNGIVITIYGLFHHFDKYTFYVDRNDLILWAKMNNFIPIISTTNKDHLEEILLSKNENNNIDKLNDIRFDSVAGFLYTKYNHN